MALEIKGLQRVFKFRKGSSEIELADPDNSLSPNERMTVWSTGSRRPSEQKGRYMAKRISIKKKEDTCKTLSESQMAGLAVLIIRADDLSYIGRGTMGREKRRLPPPGDVTLF